jgi:reactive intermediate/imine deaminase
MEAINTKNAPEAIGTYSQAMRVGNTVYLSGQIPLDKETMTLVSDDIEEQVQRVFINLRSVCEASGGNLSDIAKLTVYLTDLGDFASVNEVMNSFFSVPFPARAAIEISALPKGAKVEIDGIMVLPT